MMLACAMLDIYDENGVVQYMDDDDTLLVTVSEAMRLLRVGSRNTLWSWEKAGHGPKPISIGHPSAKRRSLRYRMSDLRSFIGASSHD